MVDRSLLKELSQPSGGTTVFLFDEPLHRDGCVWDIPRDLTSLQYRIVSALLKSMYPYFDAISLWIASARAPASRTRSQSLPVARRSSSIRAWMAPLRSADQLTDLTLRISLFKRSGTRTVITANRANLRTSVYTAYSHE